MGVWCISVVNVWCIDRTPLRTLWCVDVLLYRWCACRYTTYWRYMCALNVFNVLVCSHNNTHTHTCIHHCLHTHHTNTHAPPVSIYLNTHAPPLSISTHRQWQSVQHASYAFPIHVMVLMSQWSCCRRLWTRECCLMKHVCCKG